MTSDHIRIARAAQRLKALQAITKDLFEVLQHVEGAMSTILEAKLKGQFDTLDRWDHFENEMEDDDDDDD
jgi:hypothetical protein